MTGLQQGHKKTRRGYPLTTPLFKGWKTLLDADSEKKDSRHLKSCSRLAKTRFPSHCNDTLKVTLSPTKINDGAPVRIFRQGSCTRALARAIMSTAAKVLLTRPLPDKAQQMLLSAAKAQQIELISRDHDSAAERSWLLGQLKGQSVNGILCMLGDKVSSHSFFAVTATLIIWSRRLTMSCSKLLALPSRPFLRCQQALITSVSTL